MRQFYKASEIEPILVGFTVAAISNSNDSDDLSFTYLNNNGVAIQVVFTVHGNFIGEPYVTKENFPVVKSCETKDYGKLINEAIRKTLNQIGIPHNVKGYPYIVSAIEKCIEDRGKLNHIVKGLYAELAEENGDKVSCVERSIRNAIEVSWNRGNTKVINNLFGYAVSSEKGKPTNSEFIAYLADFISLNNEEIAGGTYSFER